MDRPSRSPLELLDEIQEVRVHVDGTRTVGIYGMATDTQPSRTIHLLIFNRR